MFKVTEKAAEQIRRSIAEGNIEESMALRVAAKKNDDGSLSYGMGFDAKGPEDFIIESEGVEIIIAPIHKPMLMGTILDFADTEEGEEQVFIFLNPNDANYNPNAEDEHSDS